MAERPGNLEEVTLRLAAIQDELLALPEGPVQRGSSCLPNRTHFGRQQQPSQKMPTTTGAWVGAEGRAQSAAQIARLNVRISEIEDVLRERTGLDE